MSVKNNSEVISYVFPIGKAVFRTKNVKIWGSVYNLLYEHIHKYLSKKILVFQQELIVTRVKVSDAGLIDPE